MHKVSGLVNEPLSRVESQQDIIGVGTNKKKNRKVLNKEQFKEPGSNMAVNLVAS